MRFLILFLLLGLFSCTPEPQQKDVTNWFDLPGFIDELIVNMDAKNNQAIKSFVLNNTVETNHYASTDSSFWAIELAKIRAIDLNSPQLRNDLKAKADIKDSKSNLLIDEYILSDESSSALRKLSIYYLEDPSEIRQIYAELKSANLIANSATRINLWVNRYNNKLLIDSLQIIGRDKTLMMPIRNYEVTTKTIW